MIDFQTTDALDILAVAILLYYTYRIMRGSSSSKLFVGIVIFVIAWLLVSQVFKMRLLASILDHIISIGGIALIILFQDDLRRFLTNLGTQRNINWASLFGTKQSKEGVSRELIMPLVLAVLSMSKRKEGGLIVLERNDGLREYTQTGELINANLSQRLIENIFFKNSPLHDGALIIRQGRLQAAGCILPVSHDIDIPKSLGLRHRSALGISQKTDALAIIISEETGNISVAMDGQFRLRLTAEELERLLSTAGSKAFEKL